MKENKIIKNYIYNLIYQILVIILPLITIPYLSRVLGAENIGIYGYTVSIVTYFTLIGALGIAKYGQREIAYVQDDGKKRSEVFWELNIIRFVSVLISTIIFYIVFCLNNQYKIYYRILTLELIAVIFDISWFFQGIEEFKKVVIKNSIVKLLSLICIFLFVKKSEDLIIYVLIYVFSILIGNLSFWINLNKYLTKINIKELRFKRHIKPMISLFFPQIATSIYTVLDKTMLGTFSNNISEVGYYEQSQKIIKVALTFVTTLSFVMLPRISNKYANGDISKINKYMKDSFCFDWFLGVPITIGIMAIAPEFVPWFFGKGYERIIYLLIYSSPIIIFISLSTTIGTQYLVSIEKQNIQTVAVLIGASINVILNCLLINKFNSYGAIIATVVAEFIIAIIEIIYVLLKKELKIIDIFVDSYKNLIAGMIMYIAVRYVAKYIKISILGTLIQVLIGAIAYIVVLIISKSHFIYFIFSKIKERITHK